jgi:hypothetical protein
LALFFLLGCPILNFRLPASWTSDLILTASGVDVHYLPPCHVHILFHFVLHVSCSLTSFAFPNLWSCSTQSSMKLPTPFKTLFSRIYLYSGVWPFGGTLRW